MSRVKSRNQTDYNRQYPADAASKSQILVVFPVPHFRPDRIDHEKQTDDHSTEVGKYTALCYVRDNKAKKENSHLLDTGRYTDEANFNFYIDIMLGHKK